MAQNFMAKVLDMTWRKRYVIHMTTQTLEVRFTAKRALYWNTGNRRRPERSRR